MKKRKDATIYDLFDSCLHRMLQAEEEVNDQLKVVCEMAHSSRLKAIYEEHMDETQMQIQRLRDCLDIIELNAPKEEVGVVEKGKKMLRSIAEAAFHPKNEALHGIIKEAKEVFHEYSDTALHDLVLSSGTQSIEMGEIAGYKTLIFLAKECDYREVVNLLNRSLAEEEKAYKMLGSFADGEAKKVEQSA